MGVKVKAPVREKFGKLTVLEEVEHTYHPNGKMNRQLKVECDCGRIVVKSLQTVKGGRQESCGQCRQGVVKDLTGIRVNRLVVTDKHFRVDRRTHWECKCDCGELVTYSSPQLINGRVHNCGKCGTKLGTYYWGDKFKNNEGYEFTLLNVVDRVATLADDEGRTFDVGYGYLKSGCFTYPYHRSVAGVGYFGVGRFIAKKGSDRHTKEYENWNSMMKRCYVRGQNNTSYFDKYVTDEWHNFQVFAEWATSQKAFSERDFHLDKDLLVKGNLMYGPDTCEYLPREINTFIKRKRLNDLPIGVDIAYNYDGTPYFRVQAREDNRNICLGRFYDVAEAFNAYKVHKEGLAKELAEKWKARISERAYNALMKYEVDIND